MDRLSQIIFGDFTEEERFLYFSDDSINSSGVEFPEHWKIFTSISSYSKQDCTQTESDAPLKVGNESNLYPEDVIQENLSPEEDAWASKESHEAFDGVSKINQVSEQIEENSAEKCDSSITVDSDKCDSTPNTQTRFFYGDERKIEVAECAANEYNELSHENVNENCDNPTTRTDSECSKSDGPTPTNVVTVGTKTMMTTSTRTVESRHEGVKSSWADLFKTKPSSKPQEPLQQMKSAEAPQQGDESVKDDILSKKDQFQHYFLDVLKKVTLTTQVPPLQPRGLKNNGNWCYINSTLQVLLFCPSFYHFLMRFKLTADRGTSFTPILDALVLFASQFREMPLQHPTGRSRDRNKQEVVMGHPFEPVYVYKLLTRVKTTLSQQGKQEDAEEFLSCILNGLHDEMVQLTVQESKPEQDTANHVAVGNEAVGEWEQVGPRNRSTVTRKATISKSPIATMFGGYLRSSLVQHGVKESASIQPFFTIPLDLRGEVSTVQQAFDNFFRVEEVEGFQCDRSKTEVEVSKKWTLDTLPVVLVLHLKRFVVNKNGCEKLTKKITYEPHLQVPMETVSKVLKIRNKNLLTYKLFAVTYHHGKNLHGGHYTSDISHPAVGWLRADDMSVRLVPSKFVFNPLSNRDPYLLYYCRGDISGKDGV